MSFSKLTKTMYKSMLGSFISAAKRPPSTIPAVVTIADFSRCLVEKGGGGGEKEMEVVLGRGFWRPKSSNSDDDEEGKEEPREREQL